MGSVLGTKHSPDGTLQVKLSEHKQYFQLMASLFIPVSCVCMCVCVAHSS